DGGTRVFTRKFEVVHRAHVARGPDPPFHFRELGFRLRTGPDRQQTGDEGEGHEAAHPAPPRSKRSKVASTTGPCTWRFSGESWVVGRARGERRDEQNHRHRRDGARPSAPPMWWGNDPAHGEPAQESPEMADPVDARRHEAQAHHRRRPEEELPEDLPARGGEPVAVADEEGDERPLQAEERTRRAGARLVLQQAEARAAQPGEDEERQRERAAEGDLGEPAELPERPGVHEEV